MKPSTLIQINNLGVQARNISTMSSTEIEISVWGLIGIFVGAIALTFGLFLFINWLIER